VRPHLAQDAKRTVYPQFSDHLAAWTRGGDGSRGRSASDGPFSYDGGKTFGYDSGERRRTRALSEPSLRTSLVRRETLYSKFVVSDPVAWYLTAAVPEHRSGLSMRLFKRKWPEVSTAGGTDRRLPVVSLRRMVRVGTVWRIYPEAPLRSSLRHSQARAIFAWMRYYSHIRTMPRDVYHRALLSSCEDAENRVRV